MIKIKVLKKCLSIILIFCIFSGCENKNIHNNIEKNITWVVADTPNYLDPGLCGLADGTDIINNMFEGLFRVKEKDIVVLGMVEKYLTFDNGRKYIFTLKKDCYWNDGKKVLPIDFEFAWKRVMNKNIYSPRKNLFLPIKNAKDILENKKDPSSLGVKAIDDRNLELELEHPINSLFYLLALTPFMPVRSDVVDNDGLWAKNPQKAISNGPFCLDSYNFKGLKLKKNKLYHEIEKGNVENINVQFIGDVNTAYRGYINNNIDIIDNLPIDELNRVSHSKEYLNIPYYGLYFYSFNLTMDCLKNKKVRQAISKSIDRDMLLKGINKPNTFAANEYIHHNFFKATTKNIFNLKESKKLFKESGYGDENKFPQIEIFYNSENNNRIIAEIIKEMLFKNLGLDVKLTSQEWSVFINKRRKLEYNGMAKNSHMYEYFSPDSFLEIFKPNKESYSGFNNSKFNILFKNIYTCKNKSGLLYNINKVLEEEAPIIPLFYYSSESLVKRYLKNYCINYIGYKYLGDICFK